MCCCWCCRCCCEDFCDEYCDFDCDCFDTDDMKQLLREWRDDYTLIITSQYSRVNASLVSQRNAYITMCFIGFFEFSVYALMIASMAEIIIKPNMHFNLDEIDWNLDECDFYQKRYLRKCFRMSQHLVPLSATLMALGTFFCCFLCKPPYGIIIGSVLRYPFAITLATYSWFINTIYSYFIDRDCISSSNADELYLRINEIYLFSYRISIYYTLIIIFMLPTFLLIYYSLFYGYRCMKICVDKYLNCITKIACCHAIYMLFTCFFCCNQCNEDRQRELLALRRQSRNIRNNTEQTNWGKDQRKKLVSRQQGDCALCITKDLELILTRGCNHGCCDECLSQYLITDLKDISKYPRKCFMNECNTLISYTQVEYVLNDNMLEEYDRMLILSSTNNNNDTISCPSCNAVMLKSQNNNNNNSSLMQCVNPSCGCDLCSNCGVLYHMNQTCDEYQSEIKSKTSGADEAFNELRKEKKWGKCPNCGLVVERSEGCYHMTHHGCPGSEQRRTDFCYFCGEVLMKMAGEGWRYSKNTQQRHFENGVYEPCINANTINIANIETDTNNDDDDEDNIYNRLNPNDVDDIML